MLVVQMGLPPKYVMEEMEMWEIDAYTANLNERHRESWEQTRFLSYIIANFTNPYRKKEVKMDDLLHFSWDDKDTENQEHTITDEEIEEMRALSKQFENKLNSNNIK